MRALAALVLLAACSDDGSPPPVDARGDAGTDAAPGDANPNGLSTTCTGACAMTSVTATFGADARTFDRAYYGVTTEGAMQTLHVEIYRGAPARCPEMNDPPPEYQVILGRVPVPMTTMPLTSPANLLDYEGDLLDGLLGAAATSVSIVPVAQNVPTDTQGMIAVQVDLVFSTGTVTGHVYATHCSSIDATL